MAIISKESWDKLTQEEKESIRYAYKAAQNKYNTSITGTHSPAEYELLFGKENLQPKPLTYDDVAWELFRKKTWIYDYEMHEVKKIEANDQYYHFNCTSEKQVNKLIAINKLLNVAACLNKNEDGTPWKPDWENMTPDDKVWILGIDENDIRAYYVQKYDGARAEIVFFRTSAIANQAIQILGEDTVRLALGDY